MPRPTLRDTKAALRETADPERAKVMHWFLKAGPGGYGEGDHFLGVRVPAIRSVARAQRGLSHANTLALLCSKWHEERLLALILMVDAYRRGTDADREEIFRAYLANTAYINNWDLVDASAEHIVGPHLAADDIRLLERLARSPNVWERRIAMIATFAFIKQREHGPALRIAELLIDDEHDLIHKAVGWMLREIGKRDRPAEEAFLRQHHHRLPRTMLRYAIEHFAEPVRKKYLTGTL